MKRVWLLLLLFLIFWKAPMHAKQRRDFRIWSYDTITIPLREHLDFYLETNFRWRDNGSTFYYYHVHLELPMQLNSHFILGPSFEQEWSLGSEPRPHEKWRIRYEYQMNMTLFGSMDFFNWAHRTRLTYKDYEARRDPDRWQLRNRLLVEFTGGKHKWKIRPYLWDEFFTEGHQRGIYENRFFCGIRFNVQKHLLEAGYMQQKLRNDRTWENNNTLVLNFKAHL